MKNLNIIKLFFLLLFFFKIEVYAKDFIIEGNQFTDDDIVISIIDKIPDIDSESKSNYILKKLISSNLFKSVQVSYDSFLFKFIYYS